MKYTPCLICILVSLTWIFLSAGVAFGLIHTARILVPIALLLGGTIVGIADKGPERLEWAERHRVVWKISVLSVGMPLGYFFVVHISVSVILGALGSLLVLAHILFRDREGPPEKQRKIPSRLHTIRERMKNCC